MGQETEQENLKLTKVSVQSVFIVRNNCNAKYKLVKHVTDFCSAQE